MIATASIVRALPRASAASLLFGLGVALSGCAEVSDSALSQAFADPAKYELYDCKQLETERKALGLRVADLQALMAKAETGVAGSVVSELAYRNDYIAVRGQMRFADEAWRKNRCHETPASAAATPVGPVRPDIKPAPPRPSRAGSAVY
jgi:hypothetical protein